MNCSDVPSVKERVSIIRAATESDIPRMVEMGLRFHANSPYKNHLPSNPEQMAKLGEQLLKIGGMLVSEVDGQIVGMLGYALFPHFISGELVCGEAFWWVEPGYRGEGQKLMQEAERLARAAGAKKMQMIAPDERVGKLYKRFGYEFVESAYQKTL